MATIDRASGQDGISSDPTAWSGTYSPGGPSGAPGTLSIEGNGDTLSIGGTQTLDHLVISIGDPTPEYLGDALFADGPGGQTSTLTLGAHASVMQTGDVAELAGAGDAGLVVNRGSISACVSGGTFTLRSLANRGQVSVGAGSEVMLAGISNSGTIGDAGGLVSVQGSLRNTGVISVAGAGASYEADLYTIPGLVNDGVFSVGRGATASLGLYGYGWTNAGTLAVAGGLLSVGGSFTLAQLGRVQVSAGGTLGLAGTLANAGTLAIGAESGLPLLALQAGGEIAGGVVADGGGGLLAQGGTFAGVTYRGALVLGSAGALATIDAGLAVTGASGGAGSLAVTGAGSALLFGTSGTLDDVAVALGAAGAGAALEVAPGQTLTLGTQARIVQAGALASIGSSGGTVLNEGQVVADQAGGTLSIAGDFANAGTLAVSNGETLSLRTSALSSSGVISVTNGDIDIVQATASQLAALLLMDSTVSVTGTLQAAGALLGVGDGSAVPVLELAGTLAGGTIRDGGGGVRFAGDAVLDGVSYQGTLAIDRPLATVTVLDGLRLDDLTGALPGSLALTGEGASLVWDSAQALDGATLSIGSSANLLAAPSLLAAAGGPAVELGGQLRIHQAGAYAAIGSGFGTFSSAATVTANWAGGQLVLGGDRFTNTGTVGIGGGDTVTVAGAEFANAGLIVVGLGGTLDLSLLDYYSSGSLAGQSFTNFGSIQMAGGMLAELTYGGAFAKVPLLNAHGASIAGAGVVASQIDNDGVVEARDGTLNLVQTVSGTGTLRVDAGSTLVLGGVGAGQTAVFGGAGGLLGLQPACFLGAIGGFAPGDTLELFDTAAQSARFAGDAIDVVLAGGTTLQLDTVGAQSGVLAVTADPHGDAVIRFAPVQASGPAQLPAQVGNLAGLAWLPAIHTT